MLRFCGKDFTKADGIQTMMAEECVVFDQNLWQNGREYFRCGVCDEVDDIRLLPIVDKKRELICYAYQNDEANRELRMLKELDRTREAMQFEDIFPEIQEVIVYGCNELAFFL